MEIPPTDNPYRPPAGEIIHTGDQGALASRGARLGGYLIDIVIVGIIVMLGWLLFSFFGILPSIPATGDRPVWLRPVTAIFCYLVFSLVQWPFLKSSGQTIGKKAMNIRIATLSGDSPSLSDLLLRRYAFFFLIAAVPVVGSLISLVGLLMIFGRSRRCLHDVIAGTKVISVESISQTSERPANDRAIMRDRSNDATIVAAIFREELSLDWNAVAKDADLTKDLRIPRSEVSGFLEALGEALELRDTDQLERCRTPREIADYLGITC